MTSTRAPAQWQQQFWQWQRHLSHALLAGWQRDSGARGKSGLDRWGTFRLVAVSDQKHHLSQDAFETTEPVGEGSREGA